MCGNNAEMCVCSALCTAAPATNQSANISHRKCMLDTVLIDYAMFHFNRNNSNKYFESRTREYKASEVYSCFILKYQIP